MVGRKIALAGVNPAIIALLWGSPPTLTDAKINRIVTKR